MAVTESSAHEDTNEWLLPPSARPRSFAELEAQIDTALALARASGEAVAEVGASAIEAAAQARRAAELAESASLAAEAARIAVLDAAPPAAPSPAATSSDAPNPAVFPLPADEDLRLAHFMERADRVVERLRALERTA